MNWQRYQRPDTGAQFDVTPWSPEAQQEIEAKGGVLQAREVPASGGFILHKPERANDYWYVTVEYLTANFEMIQ